LIHGDKWADINHRRFDFTFFKCQKGATPSVGFITSKYQSPPEEIALSIECGSVVYSVKENWNTFQHSKIMTDKYVFDF
jgi:hypothetical protein